MNADPNSLNSSASLAFCEIQRRLLPESPWDKRSFTVGVVSLVVFLVLWVYILPGYVAWRDDVLTPTAVAKHLTGESSARYTAFLRQRDELLHRIESIDTQIGSVSQSSSSLANLITIRDEYSHEISRNPPFRVVGMIGDWLNEIWIISYLTLGCLIAIWGYPKQHLRVRRIIGWTAFLYLLSFVQLWTRNHLLISPAMGRTGFYWVNWDVSKGSYLLQDLRQLGMFILVCWFWELGAQRLSVIEDGIAVIRADQDNPLTRAQNAIITFTRVLSLWQLSTWLLLLMFIPWSLMYWNLIAKSGDSRYLPAVIMIDSLWLVTWFVASRPLFVAMKWWNEEKLGLLTTWTGDSKILEVLLAEGENSSDWQVLAASLTAVGSVLLPIMKALL